MLKLAVNFSRTACLYFFIALWSKIQQQVCFPTVSYLLLFYASFPIKCQKVIDSSKMCILCF